jgi:hypothetical protein
MCLGELFFFAALIGFPNKCILKKFYFAQSRSARREKISASLRDKKYTLRNKKYNGRAFHINAYSDQNAVTCSLRFGYTKA